MRRPPHPPPRLGSPLVAAAAVIAAACSEPELPSGSFFDDRILPTLTRNCVGSPTGGACHLANESGAALGNLDLSSFDALMRRRDVLPATGPYHFFNTDLF